MGLILLFIGACQALGLIAMLVNFFSIGISMVACWIWGVSLLLCAFAYWRANKKGLISEKKLEQLIKVMLVNFLVISQGGFANWVNQQNTMIADNEPLNRMSADFTAFIPLFIGSIPVFTMIVFIILLLEPSDAKKYWLD